MWSNEVKLNQKIPQDVDVEIQDTFENSLQLGMRIQLTTAGYKITFFAHACIMVETIRLLLNRMIGFFSEDQTLT